MDQSELVFSDAEIKLLEKAARLKGLSVEQYVEQTIDQQLRNRIGRSKRSPQRHTPKYH